MKRRRGSVRALAIMLGLSAVGFGACGDERDDRIALRATADWNDYPGSVPDLGYRVRAEVVWLDRAGTCARIPQGLRVMVNDIEATPLGPGGACLADALFEAVGFTSADPVTVRLFQDDRLRGEATFEGTFPGTQAALISPPGGEARPGDDVVASFPPELGGTALLYAKWYWLGTAPSVPPFYSSSGAVLSTDNWTFTAKVPAIGGLSGPVALTFTHGREATVAATACTEFSSCDMFARYSVGPISLTVLPP